MIYLCLITTVDCFCNTADRQKKNQEEQINKLKMGKQRKENTQRDTKHKCKFNVRCPKSCQKVLSLKPSRNMFELMNNLAFSAACDHKPGESNLFFVFHVASLCVLGVLVSVCFLNSFFLGALITHPCFVA